MLQVGKVVSCEGEYSLVHLAKKSGCGGERCPLSSSLINDAGSDFYTVRARNTIGALPGDTVFVEARDTTLLFIAFLLYIFPILLALGVYLLFETLWGLKMVSLLGLLGSLVVAFLLLRRLNARMQVDYTIVEFLDFRGCKECPLLPERKS
jgi:positive regulator of sigma E activity